MNKYEVTIRATITKTYVIEADDSDEAANVAYEIFDIHNEPDVPEHYTQEIIDSVQIKTEA